MANDGLYVKVTLSGVDALIRQYDKKIDDINEAMEAGCDDVGYYLVEKIKSKFPTMTPGHKPDTPPREARRGGAHPNAMLVENGDMKDSITYRTSNRTRSHAVNIISNSIKLLWHMYGVPSRRVPKRDPVRPTVKAEKQKCLETIKEYIEDVL